MNEMVTDDTVRACVGLRSRIMGSIRVWRRLQLLYFLWNIIDASNDTPSHRFEVRSYLFSYRMVNRCVEDVRSAQYLGQSGSHGSMQ